MAPRRIERLPRMTLGPNNALGGAISARTIMDKHLTRLVGDVIQRSRHLRARASELCNFARELHDSLANRTSCPVCGSTGVRQIYRANLSGSEEASVLARRCPQGHVYTNVSPAGPSDK